MNERDARERICRLGAQFAARGLAPGTSGNISMRIERGWLMTPTNASLGALEPTSLSVLDAAGTHVDGNAPTKEHVLHRAVYAARADCGAVVHLHSTHAVGYACLEGLDPGDVFPPMTPYAIMRLGRVALVPYARPGDSRLAAFVAEAAHEHHALLLANHGPVVAGTTLDSAAAAIEELEESAKLYFLMQGHRVRHLTQAQVSELRAAFVS